jgi:hypothetical protein
MRRPRFRSLLPVAICAAAIWLGPARAESPAQELTLDWLLRSCDLQLDRAVASLQRETTEVTRLLLEAYRSGPPPALIEQVSQAASVRFSRRAVILGRPDGAGLSPQNLERAKKVDREEFVAHAVTRFVIGYRTQALRGLAILEPRLAEDLLSSEASDERSKLRDAARSLLRRSRPPS